MTRQEYLEKLKKTSEEAQKEVTSPRSSGTWNNDDYDFVPLIASGYKLLRACVPAPFRAFDKLNKPNDPIIFEQCFCINDNDKKIPIIGAPGYPNILRDLYYKAMRPYGKTEAGRPLYKLEEKDPDLFARIAKNNSTEAMEKGWKFTPLYSFNAIDREEVEWHKANGRTKLIAKAFTQKEDSVSYSDGLPFSWHGMVKREGVEIDPEDVVQDFSFIKLVEENGMPIFYDIIIWKKKYAGVAEPKAIWYKTWRAVSHIDNIPENVKLDWDTSNIDGEIGDFEFSLNQYNLRKKYLPTPAVRIKAGYGDTILRFDDVMGTNFSKKLDDLIEEQKSDPLFCEEQPLLVSIDGESISSSDSVGEQTTSEKPSDKSSDKTEEASVKTSRRAVNSEEKTEVKKVSKNELEQAGFKYANLLTDVELDSILKVDGNKLVFVDGMKLEPCPAAGCGFESPVDPIMWGACPRCGAKYS